MRKLPSILLSVGIFLIVLAPMARYFAYPRVAVAPPAQRSVSVLNAEGATIFDIGSLKEITTDLKIVANTIGDVDASKKAPGNTVVWVTASQTTSSDGVMRASDIERVAFDARSAEAVNCCDEYISTEEGVNDPVKHRGLIVKFPFEAEKKTYQWWDSEIADTVDMKYVGEDKRDGLKVYKFESDIPATQVGTMELPANLLGEKGSATLTADSMYANHRTFWVDPRTGVVIDRVEERNSTLDFNGTPRITTTKATVSFDDATVKYNADHYGTLGLELWWCHTAGPLVALILGLLLIALGLITGRRGTRGNRVAGA